MAASAVASAEASGSGEKQSSSSDGTKDEKAKNQKKEDDSNLFLDNIGKIFLSAIGGVILMMLRSSRGTHNRTELRDHIETMAVLDPMEIEDLRLANSELTTEVWGEIQKAVYAAFPSGEATYTEFVSVVVQTMRGIKGEAFTVQLGHLLDRIAIAAMEEAETGATVMAAEEGEMQIGDKGDRMSLLLLFAIFSLALNGGTVERVGVLFDAMRHSSGMGDDERVAEADVVEMVGHLQKSCQLAADAQIVLGESKYPIQDYQKCRPAELVAGGKKTMTDEGMKDLTGTDGDKWDVLEFHRLLRTKSICAWGECYVKKRSLD